MLEERPVLRAVTEHDRNELRYTMYPQYPQFDHDSTMYQGETMFSDPIGSLHSDNHQYELVMQPADGNLVVYNRVFSASSVS